MSKFMSFVKDHKFTIISMACTGAAALFGMIGDHFDEKETNKLIEEKIEERIDEIMVRRIM